MEDLMTSLSSSNFMPHGMCYLWQPDLLILHAGTDTLIALAYYSIPLALASLWKAHQDIEYRWVFKLFALFIFACGTTHLMNIWNIWNSHYYLEGIVKLLTALVSVLTAILIWPLLPKLKAIPSPKLLAERNVALKEEMALRNRAEQEILRQNESLEQTVQARTQELQQAKQALERQILSANRIRQRFESIFESAPNGMIVVNPAGQILQANELAHNIFRYPGNQLEGMQVEQLVPVEFQEQHLDNRRRYIEAPAKRMMGDRKDLYGLRSDNSPVPVEIGLNPIEGSDSGEIIASIVDISERTEYERRIESRNMALERSNKQLEEFAFIASHDLREPLRKIISFTKLLLTRDYGRLTSEGEEFADYVVNAAERMRELLDSLLSYSRVTSKGGKFIPTHLNEVIEEVLSDLQLPIDEAGAHIEVGTLIELEMDAIQIRQLFQNLLSNSLKYQHPDRPLKIQIDGRFTGDNYYQLTVEDNGIGFEPEYSAQIFEVFKRLHGRSEFSGTGMGLAICRKIVERHAGRIKAEGFPGDGAVFHIDLPISHPKVVSHEF